MINKFLPEKVNPKLKKDRVHKKKDLQSILLPNVKYEVRKRYFKNSPLLKSSSSGSTDFNEKTGDELVALISVSDDASSIVDKLSLSKVEEVHEVIAKYDKILNDAFLKELQKQIESHESSSNSNSSSSSKFGTQGMSKAESTETSDSVESPNRKDDSEIRQEEESVATANPEVTHPPPMSTNEKKAAEECEVDKGECGNDVSKCAN